MISAVVLTHNSEKSIGGCLASLAWCDEVIVIDDYSTDTTVSIAKRYNARIFSRHLADDFAGQRNFGLEKAKGPWVLFVDSDEVVSEELQKEIRQVIQTTDATGYMLKRQDILFGKPLRFGETAHVRLLRLGKTGCGVWKRSVHEVWEITGSIRSLHHPLLHYPHETLRAFIDDVNRYSTLHARELYKERKRASAFDIVAYPLGKFVYNYVIRQGFRDGTRGTILAFMMSFHSFLARGKLYFLYQKNTKESLKNTRS